MAAQEGVGVADGILGLVHDLTEVNLSQMVIAGAAVVLQSPSRLTHCVSKQDHVADPS